MQVRALNSIFAMSIAMAIILTILGPFAQAAGGTDSGGGDGDAIEFVNIALEINFWLHQHPENCAHLQCDFFAGFSARLKSNLGDPATKALIRFTETPLKDGFGVEKQALFNRRGESILVNRGEWRRMNDDASEKYDLVAAEIFGLGGVPERYLEAGFVGANVQAIKEANQQISSLDAWEVCSAVVKAEANKEAAAILTRLNAGASARFKVTVLQTYGIKAIDSSPFRFSSTTTYSIEGLNAQGEPESLQFEKLKIDSLALPSREILVAPKSYKLIGAECSILRH